MGNIGNVLFCLGNGPYWNDDRIIAFGSSILTFIGLGFTIYIARKQNQSQALFSKKVLGTLPTIDAFRSRICALLRDADKDEKSRVYIMLYWLWFGADQAYPKTKVSDIEEPEIMQLLRSRIAKRYPTTILVYNTSTQKRKLLDFLRKALEFNHLNQYFFYGDSQPLSNNNTVSDDDVTELFKRYDDSLDSLKTYIDSFRQSANNNPIKLRGIDNIPALMFAVDSVKEPCALVLLLNHDTTEGILKPAGFESYEPGMIDVIRGQIETSASG